MHPGRPWLTMNSISSSPFSNIHCDICGQTGGWTKLFDVHGFDFKTRYTILNCSSCQVKKTHPFPEDIASLYKTNFYNQEQNKLFFYCKGVLIRMEIDRITRSVPCREFVDLGSGSGEFSRHLDRKGYSVICADAGAQRPYYVKNIDEISYYPFNFDEYTFQNDPPLEGKGAILRHVLEHIRNPRALLERLLQKKIKYFYIAVPNTECLERKVFGPYDSLWYAPYHLWHFNKGSLAKLFKETGISVMAAGHDTIPTILGHMQHYLLAHRYPRFLIKMFEPTGAKIIFSSPLNLFFRNNVTWIIGQAK